MGFSALVTRIREVNLLCELRLPYIQSNLAILVRSLENQFEYEHN